MALTVKQQRFVEEYQIDFNATQAAMRAGYSKKTAVKIGSENLTKPDIQKAIQEAMRKISERTEITQDEVVRELKKVAMKEASDMSESELKYGNKLKALELLGKHLGMFDKKEHVEEETPDDGFLSALKGEAEDTWQD